MGSTPDGLRQFAIPNADLAQARTATRQCLDKMGNKRTLACHPGQAPRKRPEPTYEMAG